MNPPLATAPTLFDAAFAAFGRDVALLVFLLVPACAVTVGALALPRVRRWAQAQERADWEARLGLGWSAFKRYYLAVLIVGAVVFLGGDWWRLVAALRDSAIGAVGRLAVADPADPAQEAAFRNLVLNLGVAMTALVAAATAPFALLKAWINERATQTTEQTHLTSLFTDAIEKLGATRERKTEDGKTFTEPNIEVRLGAIYALERIAADSERDHIPVMETLCAYIRENTKGPVNERPRTNTWDQDCECFGDELGKAATKTGIEEIKSKIRVKIDSKPPVRTDTQAALNVLGRRNSSRVSLERINKWRFVPELTNAILWHADLSYVDFREALLRGAQLQGANLVAARLEGADLYSAELCCAILIEARLEGADFGDAKLDAADLSNARLQGSNLTDARLRGAYLYAARLDGADLMSAQLQGACLQMASFQGANLTRALLEATDLQGACLSDANLWAACLKSARLWEADFRRSLVNAADFTDVSGLSESQIARALGGIDTILPDDMPQPAHWAKQPLDSVEAFDDHRRWIAAGCPTTADWRDQAPDLPPA